MKVSSVITGIILIASLMMSTAIAQNAANQVSTGELGFVGTATLTAPGGNSRMRAESLKKPQQKFDLSAARLLSARGAPPASALTAPPSADDTDIKDATVLGFKGLTHLDQWSAGTGRYADSQSSKEPPDQGLAVGNGFVLEAVNTALAVYDQHGRLLKGPTAMNQFFGLAPEISATGEFGDTVTDPDCYFDRQTQRWFITAAQIDANELRAHILIAVSKSNDPTGEFNIFRIDATDDGDNGTQKHPGCPCFPDQPHVGADANGFYISTNESDIASETVHNGAQIYAMSKKQLANGKLSAVVHFGDLRLAEGMAFSVQPAKSSQLRKASDEDSQVQKASDDESNDGSGGVEYFLSTVDIFNQLDNRIAVWAISNTASLSNSRPNVKLSKVIITSEVYGPPPSAEQKSGPTPLRDFLASLGDHEPLEKLHTNNDRMQQVVFADGKLWGGLNTVVQQRNGRRAGIAFLAVAPAMRGGILKAKIARQGYLSVPGNDVLNPAIGVDGSGNAVMVFTLAGPDFYPSAAFVKINDEENKLTVHVIAPGVAPEDGLTGYKFFDPNADGIARWGDYSAATTDEDGNIWIGTEFIPTESSGKPRTGTFLAHWGTFIARVGEDDD
jgi:hypothetical protein